MPPSRNWRRRSASRQGDLAPQRVLWRDGRRCSAELAAFTTWRSGTGLQALPCSSETLVLYLTDFVTTLKPATLQGHLSAIAQGHKLSGHASPMSNPEVRLVWAGIRRTLGTEQEGKARRRSSRTVQAMIARMAPRSSPGRGDPPVAVEDRPAGRRAVDRDPAWPPG